MDQPGPSGGDPQIAKRIKLNNDQDRQADDAIAAAKVEQTGDIFKLDIDCYEEAFDYMPLANLVNVGKTCKRLQQVTGYCFQQNYSGAAVCNEKGIQSCNYDDCDLEHFAQFIQKISVHSEGLHYFIAAQSKFKRLKHIFIEYLKQPEMDRLKKIYMGKIEVLRMHFCDLRSIHELLDQCVKIKRLDITWHSIEFSLPCQKYPTMEYLKLYPVIHGSIKSIPAFLELNPNIRKFVTTSDVLWNNRDEMMAANIKLDDLAILMWKRDGDELRPIFDSLNKLHERGCYRKLILHFGTISSQETLNQLANVKGLSGLHACHIDDSLSFPVLKNLEELKMYSTERIAELVSIRTNLKRIQFETANINDIMPFIRESVEMQTIKIHICFSNSIDLVKLNRERKQLPDARKITVYVGERTYLGTKWAMKETDFELIRLKRMGLFERIDEFI